MNRFLLGFIALALPSLVAAAPCDILPYANQCQGSNLWPVPDGWAADNNGDCQPQPPGKVPQVSGWAVGNQGLCTNYRGFTKAEMLSNCCNTRVSGMYCEDLPAGSVYGASGPDQTCWKNPVDWILMHNGYATLYYPDGRTQAALCYVTYGQPAKSGYTQGHSHSGYGPTTWCPAGTYTSGSLCQIITPTTWMKPSDGICTARWTSSAKTALQKDPLDPDCDTNSCVLDGFCRLRQ